MSKNPFPEKERNGNVELAASCHSHKAIITEIKNAWPKFKISNERYSELETFNWWKNNYP